jgi:hypothetical protein
MMSCVLILLQYVECPCDRLEVTDAKEILIAPRPLPILGTVMLLVFGMQCVVKHALTKSVVGCCFKIPIFDGSLYVSGLDCHLADFLVIHAVLTEQKQGTEGWV